MILGGEVTRRDDRKNPAVSVSPKSTSSSSEAKTERRQVVSPSKLKIVVFDPEPGLILVLTLELSGVLASLQTDSKLMVLVRIHIKEQNISLADLTREDNDNGGIRTCEQLTSRLTHFAG